MSKVKVECDVKSCTHWIPGNQCTAENIDILEQSSAEVNDSYETLCQTFHKREGVRSYLSSMDNINYNELAAEPFFAGRQANPEITCNVNTCKYWGKGNKCFAEEIKVTGEKADMCEETNCRTFEQMS